MKKINFVMALSLLVGMINEKNVCAISKTKTTTAGPKFALKCLSGADMFDVEDNLEEVVIQSVIKNTLGFALLPIAPALMFDVLADNCQDKGYKKRRKAAKIARNLSFITGVILVPPFVLVGVAIGVVKAPIACGINLVIR